jgi:hypothetical protein
MSWLEPIHGGMSLKFSTHDGQGWDEPRPVAQGPDWFINWADFPSVVAIAPGVLAAHWLHQKPGSVYSYDVRMAISRDSGATWSESFTPHDDGTPTEHGFVSLFPHANGVGALWLDGRRTGDGGGHDGTSDGHAGHGSGASGAMTLRAATIDPRDLAITDGVEIDDRVCDCCQTDVAVASNGPVAVFRDRGEDETRDVFVTRREHGAWSAPTPVHADGWKIDACPVNGPAIDAAGDRVVVAWFTAPDSPRVRVAFSDDGGRSFGPAMEVDGGQVAGRVDVTLLEDGRAVVSWLTTGERPVIKARPFDAKGPAGAAMTIAEADAARAGGFPQMLRRANLLYFAWTEAGEPHRVKVVTAALR